MVLNQKDYQEIADKIEEGSNYIEIEKDGELLVIDCSLEIEGYIEDDSRCGGYMMGTGAFIETGRFFSLKEATLYDEDGEEMEFDFNEDLLYQLVA